MIAPLYGFEDKFDYFEKSASLTVVDDIAVPTFVINAADDPFFSQTFFPWHKDCENGGRAPLKLVRTEGGGHLGHLFHRLSKDDDNDDDNDDYESISGEGKDGGEVGVDVPVASFALSELGRFLDHVHTNTQQMTNQNIHIEEQQENAQNSIEVEEEKRIKIEL